MLEFEDIQHLLLTRTPALTGRYEFLSFGSQAGGRAWLAGIRETVRSAAEVRASVGERWSVPTPEKMRSRSAGVAASSDRLINSSAAFQSRPKPR